MSIEFSNKTATDFYKKFRIDISDVKRHDGRWYCTAWVTSPSEASHVGVNPLYLDFDCKTDNEAIEKAKQSTAAWIENNLL